MLLGFSVEYALERGLKGETAKHLSRTAREFSTFVGHDARFDDLQDGQVNQWLSSFDGLRKPITISNKRRQLLTLWRAAYDRRLIDHLPTRVRRLRIQEAVPHAWTLEEIQSLRAAANSLPGIFRRTQIHKADWMTAFVDFEWDTALRLGDALSVERSDIWPGNYLVIVQQKTGRSHKCCLSERTMLSLERTGFQRRSLLFPLWGDRSHFYKLFRQLRALAGLSSGSSKWLRRSSATYVEKRQPGAAMRHLGHRTPGLAYRHYVDPRICQEDLVKPPDLLPTLQRPGPS